jgi:hypothetical protein
LASPIWAKSWWAFSSLKIWWVKTIPIASLNMY